jgi:hypothetical protein
MLPSSSSRRRRQPAHQPQPQPVVVRWRRRGGCPPASKSTARPRVVWSSVTAQGVSEQVTDSQVTHPLSLRDGFAGSRRHHHADRTAPLHEISL